MFRFLAATTDFHDEVDIGTNCAKLQRAARCAFTASSPHTYRSSSIRLRNICGFWGSINRYRGYLIISRSSGGRGRRENTAARSEFSLARKLSARHSSPEVFCGIRVDECVILGGSSNDTIGIYRVRARGIARFSKKLLQINVCVHGECEISQKFISVNDTREKNCYLTN